MRCYRLRSVVCLLVFLALLLPACRKAPDLNLWPVTGTRLRLIKQPGWQRDLDVRGVPAQNGVLLRLVRTDAVAGSPRIDVVATPSNQAFLDLEAYLAKNLADMAQLETTGQVHILHVEQHRTWVGDVPAYRLHHEYTLGSGNQQVSLYQVSTCLVLDGRGITITAAGRTELFHPLARAVADIVDTMTLAAQSPRARRPGPAPIDLGRVGGTLPKSQ